MRTLGDAGEAFRVKVTYSDNGPDSPGPLVLYVGPYATLGTARACRTRLQANRWVSEGRIFTVERAAANWQEVTG